MILNEIIDLTLDDVFDEWLDYKRKHIKISSVANYQSMYNKYIKEYFGSTKLDEITRNFAQNYLDLNPSKVSKRTLCDAIGVLKSILNWAYEKDWISTPPSVWKHLKYPDNLAKKKKTVLTNNELNTLVTICEESIRFSYDKKMSKKLKENRASYNGKILGIMVAIFTGMRIGEIAGLQWKNVDFKNNVIKVRVTVERIYIDGSTQVIIGSPKSKTSVRDIPIHDRLKECLTKYKQFFEVDDECYVLTAKHEFLEPRTYRSWYDRFLERNGFEHMKFHGLRHTFCSYMQEQGVNASIVAEFMGHANLNMLPTYTHISDERKQLAINGNVNINSNTYVQNNCQSSANNVDTNAFMQLILQQMDTQNKILEQQSRILAILESKIVKGGGY